MLGDSAALCMTLTAATGGDQTDVMILETATWRESRDVFPLPCDLAPVPTPLVQVQ